MLIMPPQFHVMDPVMGDESEPLGGMNAFVLGNFFSKQLQAVLELLPDLLHIPFCLLIPIHISANGGKNRHQSTIGYWLFLLENPNCLKSMMLGN